MTEKKTEELLGTKREKVNRVLGEQNFGVKRNWQRWRGRKQDKNKRQSFIHLPVINIHYFNKIK